MTVVTSIQTDVWGLIIMFLKAADVLALRRLCRFAHAIVAQSYASVSRTLLCSPAFRIFSRETNVGIALIGGDGDGNPLTPAPLSHLAFLDRLAMRDAFVDDVSLRDVHASPVTWLTIAMEEGNVLALCRRHPIARCIRFAFEHRRNDVSLKLYEGHRALDGSLLRYSIIASHFDVYHRASTTLTPAHIFDLLVDLLQQRTHCSTPFGRDLLSARNVLVVNGANGIAELSTAAARCPTFDELHVLHAGKLPMLTRVGSLEAPPWFKSPSAVLTMTTRDDFDADDITFGHGMVDLFRPDFTSEATILGRVNRLELPASSRILPPHAFHMTSIVAVDLTHCVMLKFIGHHAFQHCPVLRFITLPHSVLSIDGHFAFDSPILEVINMSCCTKLAGLGCNFADRCFSLRNVALPSTLKRLPRFFAQLSADHAWNTDDSHLEYIGTGAFAHAASPPALPATIRFIGSMFCFSAYNCWVIDWSHLTALVSIGNQAFASCANLHTVKLPSSLGDDKPQHLIHQKNGKEEETLQQQYYKN